MSMLSKGKLNLKPPTLREPIRKFKMLKFKGPSLCDIKGEYCHNELYYVF